MKMNKLFRILVISIALYSKVFALTETEKLSEKSKSSSEVSSGSKNSQILSEVTYNRPSEVYTHSTEYVMPHMTRAPQYELQSRTVIPLNNLPVPEILHHNNPMLASCPCAASMPVNPCRPCGALPMQESAYLVSDCPCVPKPNCPACPPLSLLHDIASKRVKIL